MDIDLIRPGLPLFNDGHATMEVRKVLAILDRASRGQISELTNWERAELLKEMHHFCTRLSMFNQADEKAPSAAG